VSTIRNFSVVPRLYDRASRLERRLYHAPAKLKYALGLLNSHIFIVAPQGDFGKVDNLPAGTFHEIESWIRFIESGKVGELYKRKKAYLALERELGIYKDF